MVHIATPIKADHLTCKVVLQVYLHACVCSYSGLLCSTNWANVRVSSPEVSDVQFIDGGVSPRGGWEGCVGGPPLWHGQVIFH